MNKIELKKIGKLMKRHSFLSFIVFIFWLNDSNAYLSSLTHSAIVNKGKMCECIDDSQIECDERIETAAGKRRCFTDCDCNMGRYCLHYDFNRPTGVCMDDHELEVRLLAFGECEDIEEENN